MNDDREPLFWAVGDVTHLHHEAQFEAIEDNLDARPVDLWGWPATVQVQGWARMHPTYSPISPLDNLIEALDDEYGDPDGLHETAITERMKEAERAFIKVVLEEYDSWACEPVGDSVTVNVREWLEEHRPEWLDEYPWSQYGEGHEANG